MNSSVKKLLGNFGYSTLANALSMLISALVVLIVPKILGTADYGYYSLYVFYASYTGFFHFGWCDGIYLKYGGIEYSNYNRPLMSSQFWSLSAFELLISVGLILGVCAFDFSSEAEKALILSLVAGSIVLVIPKTLLSYFLQISNRIRENSAIVIIEKAVYFLVTVFMLLLGTRSYLPLICADLIGKLAALALSVYYCRDIVSSRLCSFAVAIEEAWDNTKIGIKLMFANIASMLILGIVRVCIENQWDIEVYAKVSLAISISNFLMVFINAISVVMFPMLKRTNQDNLPSLYGKLRDALMIVLLAMLLGYFPVKWILSLWLPAYLESFTYMSVLFPLCIFESKMQMLVNTYMKSLRKEKQLLLANLLTVVLSAAMSYLCIFVLKSIILAMVLVVVLFAFRCILCEYMLAKSLQLTLWKDTLLELLLCAAFMVCSTCLKAAPAIGLYMVCYLGYLFFKKKGIQNLLTGIKGLSSKA